MSLYVDSRSRVCAAGGTSEEFGIGVGVHQGSALSPLLFILVMEETSKDRRGGLHEIPYADDLVLTGESKEEVAQMFKRWKEDLENKGLKVNIQKTKMMISGSKGNTPAPARNFSCGVGSRGEGVNSILCEQCRHWCHKRCSGLRSLNGVTSFQCPKCAQGNAAAPTDPGSTRIDGEEIKVVQDFCYLGDMVCCEGGAERAVRARIASAWHKWKDIASPSEIRASR